MQGPTDALMGAVTFDDFGCVLTLLIHSSYPNCISTSKSSVAIGQEMQLQWAKSHKVVRYTSLDIRHG